MTWMGVIGKAGFPAQLLDFCANHSLSITIVFEHKDVRMCSWHHNLLGLRSMIDFVILSSDLGPFVLKRSRSANRSSPLVSRIRGQERTLVRPHRPKIIMRLCWERLVKELVTMVFISHFQPGFDHIPKAAVDMESKRASALPLVRWMPEAAAARLLLLEVKASHPLVVDTRGKEGPEAKEGPFKVSRVATLWD